MATGSGLDAQLGTKTESAVGTQVTVSNFFPFNDAELTFVPSYISNPSITAGSRFLDVNQVGIARRAATGKIEIPIMNMGFGWWLKHAIGSTANPVQISSTTAYDQIHTPGGLRGLSFSAQIGKPEPGTGTVQPRTYKGCKITDWSITLADNAISLFDCTVDAWDEDTVASLASASYPTGGKAFNFSHVSTFNTGGTPSTTSGLTSISTGVTVPSVVTKFTLTGTNTLATDRYGLGNAGVKKEQLESDFTGLTGAFEGEFDVTTWESVLRSGATTAIQVDSSFGLAATGHPFLMSIILPACKIDAAPAPVSGPGLVSVSGTFTVYDPKLSDGTPPVQIHLVSTDSAAWT